MGPCSAVALGLETACEGNETGFTTDRKGIVGVMELSYVLVDYCTCLAIPTAQEESTLR